MKINNINLVNFRNYLNNSFYFTSNINILVGNNAQGKTNLIEAISLLSVGKSFRTYLNSQLINFNADFCRIDAQIESANKHNDVQFILTKDYKKVKYNGKEVNKISEYVGNLNVVVFIPDDLNLIKGNPKLRRKFIDLELSKISPIYLYNINKYYFYLKERNKFLKENKESNLYLEVLNEQLASLQADIIKRRINFIFNLNIFLKPFYKQLSDNKEEISLSYQSFVEGDDLESKILKIYDKNLKRDFKYKMTNEGIHKDDLIIKLDNKIANNYASQGQQRSIVLAMKISLLYLIKKEIGEYPILLLDDVLSELDDQRKTLLLSILNKNIQTFITTTSLSGISQNFLEVANKIEIKSKMEEK